MYLRSKPLEVIEEADLDRLVKDGAQETETAEFKQQMWRASDADKFEMLKDITSLANQKGGEIYVGIREKDGVAVHVEGIDGEGHAERIVSSCRSNIERPLQGLEVYTVRLANDRAVIIVRVPHSLNGPHMVTFKGRNQFWVRHGRQKAPMTVDEIEDAFMRRYDSQTRVERFIEERKQRAWKEATSEPWLFMAVTPVFLREEIIDARDQGVHQLLSVPPEHPRYQWQILGDVDVSPSLAGLVGEFIREGKTIRRREVHRNGHIEFGTRTFGSREPREADEKLRIVATRVALQTYSFVHLGRELFRQQRVAGPVVLSLAIFNATSTHLLYGVGGFTERSPGWNEDRLDIAPIYVHDLQSEVGSAIKRLNDRLWNAFKLEACPYVTDDGDVKGIG